MQGALHPTGMVPPGVTGGVPPGVTGIVPPSIWQSGPRMRRACGAASRNSRSSGVLASQWRYWLAKLLSWKP